MTAQDAHIAGYATTPGAPSWSSVNKWDLVPPGMVQQGRRDRADPRAAAVPRLRAHLLHVRGDAARAPRSLRPGGRGGRGGAASGSSRASCWHDAAHRRSSGGRCRSRGDAAARSSRPQQVAVSPPTFALRVNRPDRHPLLLRALPRQLAAARLSASRARRSACSSARRRGASRAAGPARRRLASRRR